MIRVDLILAVSRRKIDQKSEIVSNAYAANGRFLASVLFSSSEGAPSQPKSQPDIKLVIRRLVTVHAAKSRNVKSFASIAMRQLNAEIMSNPPKRAPPSRSNALSACS